MLKLHRPKFAQRTTDIGAVGSQTGKAKMTPMIPKKSMVMLNNVFRPRPVESADARVEKGIKAVNIPSISENAMAVTYLAVPNLLTPLALLPSERETILSSFTSIRSSGALLNMALWRIVAGMARSRLSMLRTEGFSAMSFRYRA